MAVIPPAAVSPAPLQTLPGQNAPAAVPVPPVPQAIAAVQAAMSEQKAMLFAILQQALGDAAPRQNGLAPLMADAEAMLARSDPPLPPQVREAVQTLLNTRLPSQGGVDAAKLQEAVKQSGVFLESGLANGQSVKGDLKAALLGLRQALQTWLGPQTGAAAIKALPNAALPAASQGQAAPPSTPGAASAPSQIALSGAPLPQQTHPAAPSTPLRDAALRLLAETDAMLARPMTQPVAGANTPLKANLEAMLARSDAPLPQAVREAMQTVLGQRPAVPGAGDAQKLQTAVRMASPPDGLLTGAPTFAGDLKTALLGLRQALQAWLAPKADAPPPPQSNTLPVHAPSPPHRNGATVPQPPVLPGALDGLPLREAGMRLLGETDAALARHTMLQIASLPEETLRASDTTQRLVFDIPLATPQGTAIVQLRIERDGKRNAKNQKKSGWQATFSVDVEPIGPVHARIAMVGDLANVSLFAERGDSAEALRAAMPLLEAGLNEAAIEPGEILCATGAPASPVTAPGLFVDRAS